MAARNFSIKAFLRNRIAARRNNQGRADLNPDTSTTMAARNVTESKSTNLNYVEQWVSKVTKYSSQYDTVSWPASCVVGPPKVYPKYGDIAGAWAQKTKDANQYIEVQFPEKIYIETIEIYETYHSGMVKRILAKCHNSDKWVVLWQTPKVDCITHSRIFSPDIERMNFKTNELRIEVDCTVANNWCEIDAIKISGNKFSFELPPAPADITNDLAQLVNNQQYSDISFEVNGRIFYGHKAILSVRSDYFRAMFNFEETNQKKSNKVHIDQPPSYDSVVQSPGTPLKLKDVDDAAFSVVLNYIYTNKLPPNCPSQVLPNVWRTADRFSIDGLKALAIFEMSSSLTKDNVVDVYVDVISSLPVIESIKTICESFMQENMADIVRLKSFQSLPQEMMVEMIQMMTERLSLSVPVVEKVYEGHEDDSEEESYDEDEDDDYDEDEIE